MAAPAGPPAPVLSTRLAPRILKVLSSMAELFDGIESIVVGNQGGTPLTEGEHLVEICDVQHLKTQLKGDAFIVEYTVLESSDQAKNPIGSKRSWYQNMKNMPVALSEITKFVYAVAGFEAKRDEARIKTEVTPFIKSWTNAACRKPAKDAEGKDVPGKIFNGQKVRVSVKKKAPKPDVIALALAQGKPAPEGFANARFSPVSSSPPPAKTA